jgi:hypothetical protein
VRDSKIYCTQKGMDSLLPWESMLSEESIAELNSATADSKYRWDKWDYTFVGAAGVIASLIDYLLVGIPKKMTYGGGEREGSPITAFLKKKINSENGTDTWFAEWARTLEGLCKVPYDRVGNSGIAGISGQTHRLQTLGHDPILGMVFGVLDILRGTVTAFSYDHLSGKHSFKVRALDEQASSNLIEIVLRQLGHLISDVGTEKGIPAPLFTLFQGFNIPSPFSPKGRTIGEIARWMYTNGYDLRHFITMGIAPAMIEIVLRAYIMLRQYSETGDAQFMLADNPKYRCMLLTSHAIACAGNAGKIALMQGNPLAINYAEWLALVRYLAPSLKYWIFDRATMHLAHIQKVNEAGWDELCKTTDKLLTEVCGRSYSAIELR